MGDAACCGNNCPSETFDFADGTTGSYDTVPSPADSIDGDQVTKYWQITSGDLHLIGTDSGTYKWLTPLTYKSRYMLSISSSVLPLEGSTIQCGVIVWNGADRFDLYLDTDDNSVYLAIPGQDAVVIGSVATESVYDRHQITLALREYTGNQVRVTATFDAITYRTVVSDVSLSTDSDTFPMGVLDVLEADSSAFTLFSSVTLSACGPSGTSGSSVSFSSSSRNEEPGCVNCIGNHYDEYTVTGDGFGSDGFTDFSVFNGTFVVRYIEGIDTECSLSYLDESGLQVSLFLANDVGGGGGYQVTYWKPGTGGFTYTASQGIFPINCLVSATLSRSPHIAWAPDTIEVE